VLDGLPASANWDEWLDRLGTLATRALKPPDRVLAVLVELAPMGPVGPVALREVLLALERLLPEVGVPPPLAVEVAEAIRNAVARPFLPAAPMRSV
jgi:hypothetical protein